MAFDSAKNQFKLNYVQYFLTGEPKYKAAYESAQNTMDTVLSHAPDEESAEPLKEVYERSYTKLGQARQSPTSLPTQSWKYWTLGCLLIGITALSIL